MKVNHDVEKSVCAMKGDSAMFERAETCQNINNHVDHAKMKGEDSIVLKQFGWQPFFQAYFEPFAEEGFSVGRVAIEHKNLYRIYSEFGELLAEVSGKFRYQAEGTGDFPAVGDWVVIKALPEEKRAIIQAVLPRKSKFSRKAAGSRTDEQVVAANIDTAFLVMSLNYDFNVRRLERYLTLVWESGANPVVILSKADLCTDIEARVQAVEEVAFGVPIHVISSVSQQGVVELAPYIKEGKTVALLGSSGVGKSTLINTIMGEEKQLVNEVREGDDKGRHTTTYRELILIPHGGLIIDTPGMRELQLWDAGDGLDSTFGDIEELAAQCRFSDCQHRNEPGCAVKLAVEEGRLRQERLESYFKLQKEQSYLEKRQSQSANAIEKARWKEISKFQKKITK